MLSTTTGCLSAIRCLCAASASCLTHVPVLTLGELDCHTGMLQQPRRVTHLLPRNVNCRSTGLFIPPPFEERSLQCLEWRCLPLASDIECLGQAASNSTKPLSLDENTISPISTSSTKTAVTIPAYCYAFSSTYEWQSVCIGKCHLAATQVRQGGDANDLQN
jgi:hypothetical protein